MREACSQHHSPLLLRQKTTAVTTVRSWQHICTMTKLNWCYYMPWIYSCAVSSLVWHDRILIEAVMYLLSLLLCLLCMDAQALSCAAFALKVNSIGYDQFMVRCT